MELGDRRLLQALKKILKNKLGASSGLFGFHGDAKLYQRLISTKDLRNLKLETHTYHAVCIPTG